ncbi:MAG: hypothetical protein RIC03_17665 [Cyclobacteriaceae bacterium]
MKKTTIIFQLLFFVMISGVAQEKKYERERRVKPSEIPFQIQSLLQPYLEKAHHSKFYKETDFDHESFEVKFRWNKVKYSIEFSNLAELEDIEATIKWADLGEQVQSGICTFFSQFEKHKIDKIQQQFSSKSIMDKEALDQALNDFKGEIVRYELVVELKEQKEWTPYELLFDDEGILISKREITKRTTDFILY